MSSLFGTMSIAVGALQAEQGAIDATTNNVANANTPGYSRLQPVLTENDPVIVGPLTLGTGVSLQKLESLRDPILQLRIQEETQQQGQLDAFVSGMQQIELTLPAAAVTSALRFRISSAASASLRRIPQACLCARRSSPRLGTSQTAFTTQPTIFPSSSAIWT